MSTAIDWAPVVAIGYAVALAALVVVHRMRKPGPPRHAGTRHNDRSEQ